MTQALDKPFTERDAAAVLEAWCKERKFSVYHVREFTRWDYTDPPFYSVRAIVYRHAWPEKARFQIHQNGEVSMFMEGN